jgi:hypothetical protein
MNWEVGPRIYRNDQNDGNWIKVTAVGTTWADGKRALRSSRDAVGANVRLYDPSGKLLGSRQVITSNGFCGCPPLEVHFGVPKDGSYTVEVAFPSGIVVRKEVKPGKAYSIRETE